MIRRKKAIVKEILSTNEDITEVLVDVDHELQKALNYVALTGPVNTNDNVVLNTTAVHLRLGTGGHHFIIANFNNQTSEFSNNSGHIIKLRYTPLQLKCMTVEEPDSPFHKILKEAKDIRGMKVLICELHSALIPLVKYLQSLDNSLNISYIMTDSAGLPIAYSKSVRSLKEQKLIKCSITCGHAFGGDYETVNIYTALLTAKEISKCDISVVTPGPGVVGTGTPYGFSGIEQGNIIDSVNNMGGIPIFVPRISFSDHRNRHHGISHHSVTVLEKIANTQAFIPIPLLEEEKMKIINNQIKASQIPNKHKIVYTHERTLDILREQDNISTMGRGFQDDLDYFRTIGAAAEFTISH